MNIKTVIQIFIFLIIIASLYFFIEKTFLSEKQEIIDLDLEDKEVKVEMLEKGLAKEDGYDLKPLKK